MICCIHTYIHTNLISKDGQTLFQGQLKPVPHGHSISTPIVKVFMTDHAQNSFEVLSEVLGKVRVVIVIHIM